MTSAHAHIGSAHGTGVELSRSGALNAHNTTHEFDGETNDQTTFPDNRCEDRGIALEHITAVTKISQHHLVALEQEKFRQLPGGILNKGIVRGYAVRSAWTWINGIFCV